MLAQIVGLAVGHAAMEVAIAVYRSGDVESDDKIGSSLYTYTVGATIRRVSLFPPHGTLGLGRAHVATRLRLRAVIAIRDRAETRGARS